MKRKFHVQFPEDGAGAIPPCYSTQHLKRMAESKHPDGNVRPETVPQSWFCLRTEALYVSQSIR